MTKLSEHPKVASATKIFGLLAVIATTVSGGYAVITSYVGLQKTKAIAEAAVNDQAASIVQLQTQYSELKDDFRIMIKERMSGSNTLDKILEPNPLYSITVPKPVFKKKGWDHYKQQTQQMEQSADDDIPIGHIHDSRVEKLTRENELLKEDLRMLQTETVSYIGMTHKISDLFLYSVIIIIILICVLIPLSVLHIRLKRKCRNDNNKKTND